MAESGPVGTVEKVELRFEYDLTEECINRVIDETGLRPPKRWQILVDLSDDVDSPEVRRQMREAFEIYKAVPGVPELPKSMGNDVEEFLLLIQPWIEEMRGPARAAEVEAQVFESQKNLWVNEHGSDRLRMGLARGYKVNRRYALERAAREIPGAWVDTADTADLRERTDPSIEALEFEQKVNEFTRRQGVEAEGVIMWVAEGPRGAETFLEDEEAIVFRKYLGRYTAILPVDPDHRASSEEEQS